MHYVGYTSKQDSNLSIFLQSYSNLDRSVTI